MSELPISGVHDVRCKLVCKDPKDSCEHRCALCGSKQRCPFCHAPPDHPCMTVLYEEHVQYGGGKKHTHFHAARTKQ